MDKSKKIHNAHTYWEGSPEWVKPLAPHDASTKIELMGNGAVVPIRILYSIEAYQSTQYIIEESGGNEVGWLGTVRDLDEKGYLIEKIFLFKQDVSGGHCEFDRSDVGKFYHAMLMADPENKKLLNSILFWGHLHPGNMVEPSGQDENQMKVFSDKPFFIRGIFTRTGRCQFTFFDYEHGIKIIDCPWKLHVEENEELRKRIRKEMEEKVKNFSYHFFGMNRLFSRKIEEGAHGKKEGEAVTEEPNGGK